MIHTICSAVDSEDSPWDGSVGGSSGSDQNVGTITAVNGLLVVRQTQAIHDQVERLLGLLRTAMGEAGE